MLSMLSNLIFTIQAAQATPIYSGPQNDTQILVELKIGDFENQVFLINPSFNYSILQENLAVQLNMPVVMSANGRTKMGTADLWIDDHKIEKAQFILLKNRSRVGATPLAGVIGADLLQDLVLDIDLAKNKLDKMIQLLSCARSGSQLVSH